MGHLATRAELNRAGLGFRWCAPTSRGHECNFVQGLLEPATFWISFFILAFGANSGTSGEVTLSTETQNDSSTWKCGVIPEYLDLG